MNPFTFKNRVKSVIISYKSSQEFKLLLKDLNIEYIETLKCHDLDEPVNDHPDMVVHPIDYENILVYYKFEKYFKEKLSKFNINIVPSKTELIKKYPNDILINISRVGDYYFHKESFIDENLNSILNKKYKEIFVKQGYCKCSTMIIKEKTVITTDIGLYKKYESLGIKSYLLPQNHIDLPGYNTGFIGGTCGNIGKDELIFYGNLEKYKYFNELVEILKKENIKYYYPNNESFIDRGSIIGIVGG